MDKALITGIYGQDGSFLCEQLIEKGYQVYGVAKKDLSINSLRIREELCRKNIYPQIVATDIYNYDAVKKLFADIRPDEIYHMAAYHVSSEGKGNGCDIREQELFNKNILATANILECCYSDLPETRVLTAGSCLMYDTSASVIQTEQTPFCSGSLYGLAKIAENSLVDYYRKKGLFACTAILYNHESHRRGSGFVTKKIVENMVKLKYESDWTFSLGNLSVEKDWGYAAEYTQAMQLMLRTESPKDYLIATGELHTIREFIKVCAERLKIADWESHIQVDGNIINRNIVGKLCGNSVSIEEELGWERKKSFRAMVYEMIDYELQEKGL